MQTHIIPATRYRDQLERWRQDVDSRAYTLWRKRVIRLRGKVCAMCGQSLSLARIQVDHIEPYETHPHLALEVTNGRVLCKVCHRTRHGKPTAWLKPLVRSGLRGGSRAASFQRLSRALEGFERREARRIERSA